MRKYYLDNIRWATVLLVLVYHVFYIYNALGIAGGVGGFYDRQPWDGVATLLYPWFMALLFLIAGISARYALEKQTDREFLKSKNRKLLVPSTLGLFAYHAVTGYMNIKVAGGLGTIPPAILYPICVVSGIGPLWFIQMLWLFSLALTLLRRAAFCERLWALGGKATLPVLLLLFLPVWGAAQVGNTPVITVYRFGIYGLAYLLGYFVFSHEEVQERLERGRWLLLALALITGAAYNVYFFGVDYTSDPVLHHILTNLHLWMMILAILGCGKAWCDRTSPFAAYMTRSSFGIYVVHYLLCLLSCYGLRQTGLPPAADYILAILLTLGLSPLVYELLRRVPLLRYITFGIRKKG